MSGVRLRNGIQWLGCCVLASLLPVGISASRQGPPAAQPPAPAPSSATAPAAAAATSLDALAWIAGDWTGTMGRATIAEHWIPAAGKMMLGLGRTVAGERTLAFEFLRIEQRADGIVYVAQPNGRPPTEFRLTASTATSATFENPQHDHPKIIRYMKEGETTLAAEIEGHEKGKPVKQRFVFTRAPRP